MRVRFIAFLPPAALVTGLLLLLSYSIVSTLEANFSRGGDETLTTFEIVQYETECESLGRRIEAIARDVRSCQALPGCLRSENICPVAIQEEMALEYQGLRIQAQSRCAELPTHVSLVSAMCSSGEGEPAMMGGDLPRDSTRETFFF